MGKRGPKPVPADIRFWRSIDKDGPISPSHPDRGPCWLWTPLSRASGYGRFQMGTSRTNSQTIAAHRYSWQLANGPIPDSLEIDHECHNLAAKAGECAGGECFHRLCVNPAHLAARTGQDNTLRSLSPSAEWATRTHCEDGHEYTVANTYITGDGARLCKTCRRLRKRAERSTPEGRAAYNAYMKEWYRKARAEGRR